jgi:hypothetical protein
LDKRVQSAAFAAVLLAGCSASITHERVDAADDATGVRYYAQSPYLLIYSNSKGGLKWQVLYLEDKTKLMMATPHVVGGRSELTMFFQNGVLTGSSEVGDTTAIPKAIISALQSAIPLLAAMAAPTTGTVPAPSIYKIVVRDGKLSFIGGSGDVGIQVPLQ